MLLQSGLTFLICYLQVALAATSFLSVNSQNYNAYLGDDDVQSILKLKESSSLGEPIIIFQFENFNILKEMESCGNECRFLSSFDADHQYTNVLNSDKINGYGDVVEVGKLPSSMTERFYNTFKIGQSWVVFQFTASEYDIASLDEYLESAYLFLEDSLSNVEYLPFEASSVENSRPSAREHEDDMNAFEPTLQLSQKPPSKPSFPDDKLSSLWTEGLISCLLVSLILVGILVVAISWITSLEISYGALEKPANPLKKNN